MQYGQIVFLLFVAMVFYYAAMIFMDFQRAKTAQNAEQDSHKEGTKLQADKNKPG